MADPPARSYRGASRLGRRPALAGRAACGLPAALVAAAEHAADPVRLSELPLVVAITTIGVEQEQMRQSTAVALVTAGVLSVMIFPTLAIAVRRPRTDLEHPHPAVVQAGLELA